MRLLMLRDKRPGHFHQVEGLAQCIARLTPVDATPLEVRPQKFASNKVQRFVVNRFTDRPAYWLSKLYRIGAAEIGAPEAVVGSGDATIGAGILIHRLTGAKFILSGGPKSYDRSAIALILVASPRMAGEPNSAFTPIPCAIDPDRLPRAKQLLHINDLASASVALLLGGRATGYRYSDAEWQILAGLVADTAVAHGIRWSVSNSLRTPDSASELFRRLAGKGIIEQFVDYRIMGPGSANHLFAADAIVVTEDSRSMAAEAMAARRPVIIMKPREVAYGLATERVVATVSVGGAAVMPIATVEPDQFARLLVSLRVSPQDPRDLIAAAVAPVLGLDMPGPKGSTPPTGGTEPTRVADCASF